MNKLQQLIEKIDTCIPASKEYHNCCSEYFKQLAKESDNKEDRDKYNETADFHKLIGETVGK